MYMAIVVMVMVMVLRDQPVGLVRLPVQPEVMVVVVTLAAMVQLPRLLRVVPWRMAPALLPGLADTSPLSTLLSFTVASTTGCRQWSPSRQ